MDVEWMLQEKLKNIANRFAGYTYHDKPKQ